MSRGSRSYVSIETVLACVVLAALALRWSGVRYGLPHIYTTDEIFEVKRALQLGAGHFDISRSFKGGLYYLLFLEYGVYYALLRISGQIQSTAEFLNLYFQNPSAFWILGRLTAGAIGALNVYLVFRLGSKLYGRRAGLISALFLAFTLEHLRASQVIGVDIAMITLLTATFLLLVELERTGSRRAYLQTALWAALAVMTKMPAIIVLLPIVIGHVRRAGDEGRSTGQTLLDRRLWLAALLFLVVTLAGNPGFLGAFKTHLAAALRLSSQPDTGVPVVPYALRAQNVWGFYAASIARSLGWAVFAAALLGFADQIRRGDRGAVSMAAFVLVFYLCLCLPRSDRLVYDRYSLPIQLLLVVQAGRFVAAIAGRLPFRGMAHQAVLPLAFVAFTLPPVLGHVFALSRTDSRTIAKYWIEAHIPAGSRIAIEGSGYGTARTTVPLNNTPQNVESLLESFRKRDARWEEDLDYGDKKNRFHTAYLKSLDGRVTYDLFLYGSETAPYRPLDDYMSHGVEYIVVRQEQSDRFLQPWNRERFPDAGRFYSEVRGDHRLETLVVFPPNGSLGPTIQVYKTRKDRVVEFESARDPERETGPRAKAG